MTLIIPLLISILITGDVLAFEDAGGHGVLFVFPPSTEMCCLNTLMKSRIAALGYEVKDERFFDEEIITGTGFFISRTGLLVTNSHVIENARTIYMRKLDGTMLEAKVLINDPLADIAVLAPIHDVRVNSYLILGRFEGGFVGDPVVVLGYPFPKVFKDPKFSVGIIRAVLGLGQNPERFEFNAPIQPGSSGSPVLNKNKEVIGIVNEQLLGMSLLNDTEQLPPDRNYGIKIECVRKLLDNHSIAYRKHSSGNPVSLSQVMDATAVVMINTRDPISNIPVPQKGRMVLVDFSAVLRFDLINYTIIELMENGADHLTPEIITTGSIAGSPASSPKTVSDVAVDVIVQSANSF